MPGYELADYEPAQRDDYLRLLSDAWGDLALTGEEFDWWFRDNPAGSLMSVARLNGRLVGVASHSLARMVVGGEQRLASFSVHATTDPIARGQGIFAALERKHEEEAKGRGAAIALAFASGRGRFRACNGGPSRSRASSVFGTPGTPRGVGRTTSCAMRSTSTGVTSCRRATTSRSPPGAVTPFSATRSIVGPPLRTSRISSATVACSSARALRLQDGACAPLSPCRRRSIGAHTQRRASSPHEGRCTSSGRRWRATSIQTGARGA